ncbi:hypothetical protein [Frigoribacterium sp. UYMn621]|uniref:hypothetical protein n=1 Tax=Frigoribacterium sp. UYMn621 TaxID=3156343 RepID=UPI00339826EE
MSDPINEAEEIAATVTEAKGSFDLKARLMKRGLREKRITLYTDEVAGEELGYAKDIPRVVLGSIVGNEREREGVLGEIDTLENADSLDAEQENTLVTLKVRANELRSALESTAITVDLRAVPPIIAEDARRKAKRELNLKGPGPFEDENWPAVSMAKLLQVVITGLTDHATGETTKLISFDDAKALKDFLPASEYLRLDLAIGAIQFKTAIDESVTGSADFSPAI